MKKRHGFSAEQRSGYLSKPIKYVPLQTNVTDVLNDGVADGYAYYCNECGLLKMFSEGTHGEAYVHLHQGKRHLAFLYGFGEAIEKGLRAIASWPAVSERIVARDCDRRELIGIDCFGSEVRVGDTVANVSGERVLILSNRRGMWLATNHETACAWSAIVRHWTLCKDVPTPQADEGEVRGYRKSPSAAWPQINNLEETAVYFVEHRHIGQSKCHVVPLWEHGRRLTLREVVDILAPETKDVPGPADCERCYRCQGELVEECCFETPAGLICADCATAKATQPAAVGAVTCDDCRAVLSDSQRVDAEGSTTFCVYCFQRFDLFEQLREHPRFGIAVAPVEDVEGDIWERPGWES